ncbi:hypothetical protein PMAYCL1PPCAC_00501, partial [Pristionchus mayeri]
KNQRERCWLNPMVAVDEFRATGIMFYEQSKLQNPNSSNVGLANVYMKLLQQHGDQWMQLLHEKIGEIKPCCEWCNLSFDDCGEYYNHLLTYTHLYYAHPFDHCTLTFNYSVNKQHVAVGLAAAAQRNRQHEQPDQPPNQESDEEMDES